MVLRTRVISFIWGFAEATFFFFVPDVWLTRIALTDLKEAFINAFIALTGALLGGCVLYILASQHFDNIRQLLDYVPAISDSMIDKAGVQMQEANPVKAIITAGFTGVPFKIYAVWSGYLSISFPIFLLVSAVARVGRFLSLVITAFGISSACKLYVPAQKLLWLHAGLWGLFYCYYFLMVGR